MSKTVMETFYGSYSKFEVVKDSGTFSTEFKVYKDGKFLSSFSSLARAVEYAKKQAGG